MNGYDQNFLWAEVDYRRRRAMNSYGRKRRWPRTRTGRRGEGAQS
jgi:hypothetical protein